MKTKREVAQVGCDCHRLFSRITARDEDGRIIWRQRLEHGDRTKLREQLSGWPEGTPVIVEGIFGWRWLSDEFLAAGLDPHLASNTKMAAWREARGLAAEHNPPTTGRGYAHRALVEQTRHDRPNNSMHKQRYNPCAAAEPRREYHRDLYESVCGWSKRHGMVS